jgi:hypothetical protein
MPKDLDSIIFTICIYTHLQLIKGMLFAMGTITVEIFLLRQSDIGTDAGIVLMNGAKDYEHEDSDWIQFLFSQSDNRHMTISTWTVPSSFTASFPPHFTSFACT